MADSRQKSQSQALEENYSPADEKKRLKEEKKKLKQEQKSQKKEAKQRAKEIEAQEDQIYEDEGTSGSGASVFFITLFIVLIWIAILALVIKLDIGGAGTNIFSPMLKDVPVLNKILPTVQESAYDTDTGESYGGYQSLDEAVAQIRRLEQQLDQEQQSRQSDKEQIEALQAEVERLKTFEDNQVEFQRIKEEFYGVNQNGKKHFNL